MELRNVADTVLTVLLVAALVALALGQFLGQPILLGYVETGSMEPTLDAGDGFLAVPSGLTGEVEEGDVVVFEAEEIQGGGLTTHRVVGETDRGYVTRGDANPFTDQDGGEPPVQEARIVAEALQIGGTVVVIPNLGTAVMTLQGAVDGLQRRLSAAIGTRALLGTQGLALLLFGLSVVAYAVDSLVIGSADGKDRARERDRDDGLSIALVLAVLTAVVVVSATAAMVVPAGTQEFGVITAEFDSENPTVIPSGESESVELRVPNAGLVPVHVYLEPESPEVDVEPSHVYVGSRSTETATVTLEAPPRTGYYRMYLREYRYLALLPKPVIAGLYGVHPWLPIVAVNTLLGGGVYLLGRVLVGSGRVRSSDRESPDAGLSVNRLLRSLYR